MQVWPWALRRGGLHGEDMGGRCRAWGPNAAGGGGVLGSRSADMSRQEGDCEGAGGFLRLEVVAGGQGCTRMCGRGSRWSYGCSLDPHLLLCPFFTALLRYFVLAVLRLAKVGVFTFHAPVFVI